MLPLIIGMLYLKSSFLSSDFSLLTDPKSFYKPFLGERFEMVLGVDLKFKATDFPHAASLPYSLTGLFFLWHLSLSGCHCLLKNKVPKQHKYFQNHLNRNFRSVIQEEISESGPWACPTQLSHGCWDSRANICFPKRMSREQQFLHSVMCRI